MNKLYILIIGLLVFFVLIQNKGCVNFDSKSTSDTLTVRDTVWQVRDSLIIKKLKIKEVIYDTIPQEYIADTSYSDLKNQYDSLVIAYLAKNIYADTLKLDTLGYVAIADTVYKNELLNRSYKYNYKIPTVTVTTTITKQAPAKGALFIGGGIMGTTTNLDMLHTGLLYKNKKGRILGLNVALNTNGQIIYGIQSYWKIR